LMALAACVYMAALGKCGLRQVANLCYQKAHYAAQKIAALDHFEVDLSTPFFHEFVVKCPSPVDVVNEYLLEYGILGGLDLGMVYPELENHMLLCVTEMNSVEQIDDLVSLLEEVVP